MKAMVLEQVGKGLALRDVPRPHPGPNEERVVRSVANLTRRDAEEFFDLAPRVPVKTRVTAYSLHEANEALADLRCGRLQGAGVLVMPEPVGHSATPADA